MITAKIEIPNKILKFIIIFVANIIIKNRICKFLMLNLCFYPIV